MKTKIILQLLIGVLICGLLIGRAEASNQIDNVRVWPSPDSTRVVFDLKNKPDYSYFMLKNPNRLVIDFKETRKESQFPALQSKNKLIKKIRTSKPKKKGWSRVVVELKQSVKPVVFALAPTGPYRDRLVVDLYSVGNSNKPANQKPIARERKTDRDIVVAIVAGHGGEDPGSIGPSGTFEKYITLSIAKRLQKLIDSEKGMKAVMVRTGDYYVKLNTRTERARKYKADFLISIHADAFTTPQPRGASVWVLSQRRANTEVGRWLEDKEKHSDLLGGAADVIKDTQSEKYLAQALLDMSMDHSMKTSFEVAGGLVKELRKVTKMHKKRPQSASFAVLKSPDIPSILVETGFISNPHEEKLLKTAAHQNKLARAMFNSVKQYFRDNPPDDSLFANLKSTQGTKHKVRSGESLSLLAHRYGTSVQKLKSVNKLKSNTLFIGQTLTIPQS